MNNNLVDYRKAFFEALKKEEYKEIISIIEKFIIDIQSILDDYHLNISIVVPAHHGLIPGYREHFCIKVKNTINDAIVTLITFTTTNGGYPVMASYMTDNNAQLVEKIDNKSELENLLIKIIERPSTVKTIHSLIHNTKTIEYYDTTIIKGEQVVRRAE